MYLCHEVKKKALTVHCYHEMMMRIMNWLYWGTSERVEMSQSFIQEHCVRFKPFRLSLSYPLPLHETISSKAS